jgi:nitronate monooxygenase
MKNISGSELAVAVSEAGGFGFIGPGNKTAELEADLKQASALISRSPRLQHYSTKSHLPIGVGFQTWNGDLPTASRILSSQPTAVAWLFAPRHGQQELDEWSREIRKSSQGTQIWIQVASVAHAIDAARSTSPPDVLVVQGTDAGGHSLTQGAGIITLLPEVADALSSIRSAKDIPIIAAGGIIDSRGAAAAFALGALGVNMGTRFLASKEAKINPGYQRHVVSASDGGQTTVRTQLYNHLRGLTTWPTPFDARGLINQSWRDHKAGMPFEKNAELHKEAMKKGEDAWGENGRTATYAGTGVGLLREVKPAGDIVKEIREGITGQLEAAVRNSKL